jgi:homoserine kinase
VTVHVRAPASTANLGPGFDCAAAALDLWNEVTVDVSTSALEVEIEGEGADELPRDATHLTLRAFALYAPPERYRFRFVNRIPLERGLGASAAAIALGLLAGAALAGREQTKEELLQAGEQLEGHADNLAAALWGGVCATWRRNGQPAATRLADDMPAAAVLAVPNGRTSTTASRAALPATVAHGDAAANGAAATLLGAAIVRGDAKLLRDALHDRLHEPYRSSPLLEQLRALTGTVGVTLSGSGPSVVVWADKADPERVVAELRRALPDDTRVLPLRVAPEGASVS